MKSAVRFSIGLMLFSSWAQSAPWGLPGNAVIASEGGRLLICVPQKIFEDVGLASISVTEKPSSNDRSLTMWQLELKKNAKAITLATGNCIYYGVSFSEYQSAVPAKPLRVGSVYYTRINVKVVGQTRNSILFYDAVFCVAQRNGDEPVYLQYINDQAGNEVRPLLCQASGEEK